MPCRPQSVALGWSRHPASLFHAASHKWNNPCTTTHQQTFITPPDIAMQMLRRSAIAALPGLLALLIGATENDAIAQSQIPTRKQDFHLYLLIGQSNMAGRGALVPDEQPHPRVLKLNKENQWVPATEPLHFDKPIAGACLATSFARDMASATPEKVVIGLIPAAVGGTPLSRWEKDGDLWKQALERLRIAQQHGTLKGILWHQGESDATPALAPTYGKRLATMITDLRSQLGTSNIPFVAGQLGMFMPDANPNGTPNLWREINKEIEALPTAVPHTAVVSSDALGHKGDKVHFDTPALRELGKRYAEAMSRLQRANGESR